MTETTKESLVNQFVKALKGDKRTKDIAPIVEQVDAIMKIDEEVGLMKAMGLNDLSLRMNTALRLVEIAALQKK